MKKILSLLALFFWSSIIMIITSLAGCVPKHYKFIYQSGNVSLSEGGSGSFYMPVSDSCRFDRLYIRDSLQFEIITAGISINSGNQLYAWQFERDYTPVEKVSDIRVYTIFDYNSEFPAGSNMSSVVKFYDFYTSHSAELTKDQVITSLNTSDESDLPFRGVSMQITAPPATSSTQQFIVEIRTEVNAVIRSTSASVVVTP